MITGGNGEGIGGGHRIIAQEEGEGAAEGTAAKILGVVGVTRVTDIRVTINEIEAGMISAFSGGEFCLICTREIDALLGFQRLVVPFPWSAP